MKKEKYNIGLDIGTTSVGWSAVSTEDMSNPKVLRKGNKYLWGVRLFDSAETASKRRTERSTRRRYSRRRARIKRLQDIFKDEINKVDPMFFQKLKDSFYSDKDIINKKVKLTKEDKKKIFNNTEDYPTIYHLRKALIEKSDCDDIRLIYLAIHHIIKYRGNFLYDSDTFSVSKIDIPSKLKEIIELIDNEYAEINIIESESIDIEKFSSCVLEKSRSDRKIKTKEILSPYFDNNFISEFCKLIIGNKFNVNKLLNIESEEKVEISFNGTDYEEKIEQVINVCGDKIYILDMMKELYDMIFLNDLFKGRKNTCISSLMVDKYNEHKNDLKYLKKMLNDKNEIYIKLFKDTKEEKCIYKKYIDNGITYDDFVKIFKEYIEDEEKKQRIEDGIFLPRITDKDNGKYPYQLNKEELIKIISNYSDKFPFLGETINDNGKEEYKIVKLLSFKIPYYVGPLNNTTNKSNIKNKNSWISLKEGYTLKDLTPYNFNKIVDKDKSAEEFIRRMISKCTYILDEYAMANNSILYSKFKVLNELKQITINGEKIPTQNMMQIYNELFLKHSGSITEKVFVQYLYTKDFVAMYDGNIEIKGYSADGKFANNMQPYIDFFGENGILTNTKYKLDDAERIIEWITIFEDKEILERKVRKEYPELSEEKVKQIINKKYKGWGSLSKKLLTEVYYIKDEFSERKSIIDLMEETRENFMQILFNDKYKFQDKIDKLNTKDNSKKISYSLVDELATSPANKRGIYQALKIIDELVNYIGYLPEHICIEMARGEENTGRTNNRKKYLQNIYTKIKSQINDYKRLNSELNKQDEKNFTTKLFLYFIQEGKCLYSGRSIDIEHLEECEIDHIIPRTLIKDDSIDNKALVYRTCNQSKGDSLVLPQQYRNDNNKKWWRHLYDVNLISKKKYINLIRKEFNEKDIEGFINRQIVETRQITKHVANIINNIYYGDSNKKGVIYINANLSHQYREKNELYKFRDLNDYHHSYDAYLAATLGEYVTYVMKKNVNMEYLKDVTKELYKSVDEDNKKDIYKKLGYGLVINSIDNKYAIVDEDGVTKLDLDNLNNVMINNYYRNDILVTKKTEIRTGAFYKETKYPKSARGISIKENLPTELYGYYSNVECSYMMLVEYGKQKRKIIGIPIYIDVQSKSKPQLKDTYIRKHISLRENEDYIILKDKIPFNIKINLKNSDTIITGYSMANKNCELQNATENKISKTIMIKYKNIVNDILNRKIENIIFDEDYENNINELYKYLLEKIDSKYPHFIKVKQKICNVGELIYIEKFQIVKQLIILLGAYNASKANLSFVKGLGNQEGRLNGNNITTGKLIYQSITGVYEEEYEF